MTLHDRGIAALVENASLLGLRDVRSAEQMIPVYGSCYEMLTDIDVLYLRGHRPVIVELKTGENLELSKALRQLTYGSEYARRSLGEEPVWLYVHLQPGTLTTVCSFDGVGGFEPFDASKGALTLAHRLNGLVPHIDHRPEDLLILDADEARWLRRAA